MKVSQILHTGVIFSVKWRIVFRTHTSLVRLFWTDITQTGSRSRWVVITHTHTLTSFTSRLLLVLVLTLTLLPVPRMASHTRSGHGPEWRGEQLFRQEDGADDGGGGGGDAALSGDLATLVSLLVCLLCPGLV